MAKSELQRKAQRRAEAAYKKKRYNADPEFRKKIHLASSRSFKKRGKTPVGRAAQSLSYCKSAAKRLGFHACNTPVSVVAEALVVQEYSCAICGRLEETLGKRLAMDHCHETGKFRGWLCEDCNRGLGLFRDNPIRLANAAVYVLSS